MADISQDQDLPTIPKPVPSPILFGRDGLRAGWGLLIALVLMLGLFRLVSSILHASHLIPSHALEYFPTPFPVFLS